MLADDAKPLSNAALWAYCGYAIPVTALPAVVMNLIPPYFAESFGLSLAAVGTTFFALRLFDAVTDPAMGWLVDKRPFKRQHKPWLVLALPAFLLGIALLFYPPQGAGFAYLFIAGFVTYSAYTIGLVTHQAWGAALAKGPGALQKIFGFREYAVIAGILGGFLAPAIAEALDYSGLESKVIASSLFLFATFLVFTVVSLVGAPDRSAPAEPPSLRSARAFVVRRDFVLLVVANLAYNFSMVSLTVLSYFLAAYAFGEADRYAMALTCYFIAAAAGMVLWMRLAKSWGEKQALILSAIYACIVLLPIRLWVEHAPYLLFMAVLGVAFGAAPFLIRSMIGHLAERHESTSGDTVRGVAYAAATFCDKLGSGVAAGIVLPLVGALGFVPDDVTQEGVSALLLVLGTVPVAGFILLAIAVLFVRRPAPIEGDAA